MTNYINAMAMARSYILAKDYGSALSACKVGLRYANIEKNADAKRCAIRAMNYLRALA